MQSPIWSVSVVLSARSDGKGLLLSGLKDIGGEEITTLWELVLILGENCGTRPHASLVKINC